MAKAFKELRDRMSPERQKRNSVAAQEAMVEMLLGEIRREAGLTQTEMAARMDIQQPTLSRLESQNDMQVSTLRRLVEALGGELELVARLPGVTVKLSQFGGASRSA